MALTGCNDLKRTWKYTTDMYTEYIEPVPEVDLDTDSLGWEEERRLSRLMKPVDEPLQHMLQYLDGRDMVPDSQWLAQLFEENPWISGVIITDSFGNIQFQHPASSVKPVDVDAIMAMGMPAPLAEGEEPLLDEDGEPIEIQPWNDHAMRGMVQDSTFGPEIYVAYPFYENNDFDGLTIVHFDPRNLLIYCPEPDELIILAGNQVLSGGSHEGAAAAMAAEDWEAILMDDTDGWFSDGATDFYWIGRTLGRFHMVYAARADEDPEPEETEVSGQ